MSGDDIDKWIDAHGWDLSEDGWVSEFEDLKSGPPLSDHELQSARADLARWRSPIDFRRAVAGLHKRCCARDFMSPKATFLRDAWTLAKFVRHKSVDQVRLADPSDRWPDGYVKIDQTIENVEVTMAPMPGRKMWDEYQPNAKPEYDPDHNRVKRAEAIPAALEKAITDKLKRQYGSKMWLVVYLNINAGYGSAGERERQAETERAIAEIKQRHAGSVEQLFVIWNDKLL
jgi:hypothetical protein